MEFSETGCLTAVCLAIYYSTSHRLEVYVNNTFVPPTNAEWNVEHTDFTLKGPTYTGECIPKLDSPVPGANYFDRTYQMLNVLVRRSTLIEVHTSPVLHISFNLPAMTMDEFYGPNLVENLALFLNVPPSKICITIIVQETGHRRKLATGITVKVEIGDPPLEQFSSGRMSRRSSRTSNPNIDSSNPRKACYGIELKKSDNICVSKKKVATTNCNLHFSDLREIASSLGEAKLSRNLNTSLGFTVSAMDISSPVPPPGDAQWTQDNCVSVGVTSWEPNAILMDSQNVTIPGLNGTTSILFNGCWANYTDLAISTTGTSYKLMFQLKSIQTRSNIFSVEPTFQSSRR
ncbi:PKHD1 like 1, tandem duplicate 2 [Carcharodon carcharias]|uniref:PKHD1 like 1, tandem duplicate 2 n=1 Tax=Carcharodon carcharias TaxID=13397 RepID=UPI001B7E9EE4|nr:PKHD1 like 1, tandem duplicate 2 [Carcharodon carcharias]